MFALAGLPFVSRARPAAAQSWVAAKEGVRIEASITSIDAGVVQFRESDRVRVSFRITDEATGSPISGLYPAAWLDRIPGGRGEEDGSCRQKVETYLGGSLFAVPEVDLNVYHVLALNEDGTISVVDPLFGFGGSKLLEMIQLPAPGEDWAMTASDRTLLVTMPSIDQVAKISTDSWRIDALMDVAAVPVEIALQPDEHYAWIGTEGTESGVTVVRVEDAERVAHLVTGPGPHHLAFSSDSRWAFVTNGRDESLSVVDVGALRIVRTVALGARPVALDWSEAAQSVYVSTDGGDVLRLTARDTDVAARIEIEPSLGRIRFAPGGRFGFVLAPSSDAVHVIDASRDEVIQSGDVEDGPDQVTFSDELAYIRHAGSEIVLMIPLDVIEPGAPLQVIDFPGGERAPLEAGVPSPADAIVQAPGANAVLVANPVDEVIYFYKEGMAAPMGKFKNYGRMPRAVEVVDRSLEEYEPGIYSTAVKLQRAGEYDLAFFLDAPQMVACFDFDVATNPTLERERADATLGIELRNRPEFLDVGRIAELRFQGVDPLTGDSVGLPADLEALVFLAPGSWHSRIRPEVSPNGVATVAFKPFRDGLYYIYFESRSAGIEVNRSPGFILEARRMNSAEEGGR